MSGDNAVFVDSNVILYWLDARHPAKRQQADEWLHTLWNQGAGRISWQVIHEFYSNATRKLGVSEQRARIEVEDLLQWAPVGPSTEVLQRAWHWCDVARINFWDSLIVASAEHAECRWLLSEDLQAGRTFGKVTVINPFETAPSSIFSVN